jgi:hypothetical protein
MKKLIQITLLVSFALIASPAFAQDNAATNGPVWRVTYIKLKPGKLADHTKWMREYRTRVLAEHKSAGLIIDYKFFTQPTGDNSPGNWHIAEAVLYRNYGEALDAVNEERSKKAQEIRLKVFGSAEHQRKVWAELRDPSSEVVATRVVREFSYNPVKPAASGN